MVKQNSLKHKSSSSKLNVTKTSCCSCCSSHHDNYCKIRSNQLDAYVQTKASRNHRLRLTAREPHMSATQSCDTLSPAGSFDADSRSKITRHGTTSIAVGQTSVDSQFIHTPGDLSSSNSSTRSASLSIGTTKFMNINSLTPISPASGPQHKLDSGFATMNSTIQMINGFSMLNSTATTDTAAMETNPLSCCRPAPFSHEPLARSINENCDYSLRITAEMAKANLAPRAVRIYADGAYDMFHSGHARQLMQAKCAFPNAYLIVGVSNDADVHRYKGRTVMNEIERYEAVRHCRYVDEVVTDAPWSITDDFLQKHKIDFVAHDDIPYASADCEDIYKPLKEAGMFVVTQRTEGISTTDVIGRIVRDYDVYLRRNIRRGLSRKDLNISYMKEKKLQLQDNFENMMKRGTSFIQNVDNKRREFVDHLEDISHDIVRSFMRIFGSDGRLRNWLSNRRLTDSNYSSMASIPSDSNSGSTNSSDDEQELQMLKSKRISSSQNTRSAPRRKRAWSTSPNEETCTLNIAEHNSPSKLKRSMSTSGDGFSGPESSYTDPGQSTRTRRSLNSYREPVTRNTLVN